MSLNIEMPITCSSTGDSAEQAAAHYRRGTEFGRRKQYAEAQAAFEKAIELSQDDAASHRSLGTALADQEKFDEANIMFRKAASLQNGKRIWRWKSLGFCPSVFSSENDIEQYWQRLNENLDEAIVEKVQIDWRTLLHDGCIPSFNLPHHGKSCREVREKFYRLFERAFDHASRPMGGETSKPKVAPPPLAAWFSRRCRS